MNLVDSMKIALRAIRLNAMRSFLTMLGIIIGVASVIVMVSVSSGAQKQVEARIQQLGTNLLRIRPGSRFFGGRRSGAGTATPFSDKDIDFLKQEFSFINSASGRISSSAPVISSGLNWQTSVIGTHTDYFDVRDWVVAHGRGFTEREVRTASKVAILGQTVIKELFGESSPLNAKLRIKNVPFTIIGVLEEKGQSSFGHDQDDIIVIPISTARQRISGRSSRTVANNVGTISLKIDDKTNMNEAQAEIERYLRKHRKIKPGAADDFSVRNMAEFIRARTATQKTLGILLAAAAAIALVVGGIGIMNIMLVSVTERTREIGLRMAVGANQRDILSQFLVEAVTLCLIGSLIGVVLGISSALAIAKISQWPVLVSLPTIFIAITAAGVVGVFFGFYPARKASLMHPIDALRYE